MASQYIVLDGLLAKKRKSSRRRVCRGISLGDEKHIPKGSKVIDGSTAASAMTKQHAKNY